MKRKPANYVVMTFSIKNDLCVVWKYNIIIQVNNIAISNTSRTNKVLQNSKNTGNLQGD